MSRLRAAIAALILVVAVPASTFAVTGSATVAETLTVIQAAAITVTGLPSTIDLGSALPGQTTSVVTIGTAAIVPLGGVTTYSVSLTQTALTSGPNSIPATAAEFQFDTGSGSYGSMRPYPIVGTIFDQSNGNFLGIKTHWLIPAGTVAGSYTGTLTVSATGS